MTKSLYPKILNQIPDSFSPASLRTSLTKQNGRLKQGCKDAGLLVACQFL